MQKEADNVHNTFEPPFDKKVIGGWITFLLTGGTGVIVCAGP